MFGESISRPFCFHKAQSPFPSKLPSLNKMHVSQCRLMACMTIAHMAKLCRSLLFYKSLRYKLEDRKDRDDDEWILDQHIAEVKASSSCGLMLFSLNSVVEPGRVPWMACSWSPPGHQKSFLCPLACRDHPVQNAYKGQITHHILSNYQQAHTLTFTNAGRFLVILPILFFYHLIPNMQSFQYVLMFLALLISTVSAAPAINLERRSKFTGDGTYFTVGLGSCGKTNTDSQMVAALNAPQMGSNKYCGKSATVTGPNGSVTVTIVDTCPECSSGSLDLSPAAFKKIGDVSAGRIKISWNWD